MSDTRLSELLEKIETDVLIVDKWAASASRTVGMCRKDLEACAGGLREYARTLAAVLLGGTPRLQADVLLNVSDENNRWNQKILAYVAEKKAEADTRVAPSVPRVEPIGSTAEKGTGEVTAGVEQAYDGEWIEPTPQQNHTLVCCDCGLAHSVDFRIEDGRVQFRAYRDVPATDRWRSDHQGLPFSQPAREAEGTVEDDPARVAPLTAGADGQELPRRSPPGAVTAAERPEKDRWMNCQQRISNRCPACGNQTLFIAVGGWLTCSWLKCPAPCAIGNLADHHR